MRSSVEAAFLYQGLQVPSIFRLFDFLTSLDFGWARNLGFPRDVGRDRAVARPLNKPHPTAPGNLSL